MAAITRIEEGFPSSSRNTRFQPRGGCLGPVALSSVIQSSCVSVSGTRFHSPGSSSVAAAALARGIPSSLSD